MLISISIIFIAHSLGGIVVKDALAMSRNASTPANEVLPATLGVIFLGTPHRGSKVASLAKVVFQMTKVLCQKPNTKILAGLEPNSEILERISREFGNILALGKLRVHSFREELDTNGIRVVDRSSSTMSHPSETSSSIHANHRDIAAFSSLKEVGFERIQDVFNRWWCDYKESHGDGSEVGLISENPGFLESYSNCLRSLHFPELGTRLANVQPSYQNTLHWIFDEAVGFSGWLKGESGKPKFWITGRPGSGKSTTMKFAMNHQLLREKLMGHSQSSWIIVGFFFDDRGSPLQKSPEGFLREIIYKILKQSKDMFPIVYKVYVEANDIGSESESFRKPWNVRALQKDEFQKPWDIKTLHEVLTSLVQKSSQTFRLCLFVDALDEHNGNHRSLLRTLDSICHTSEDETLRIRLCLASRPENIFHDAFGSCPQISIHEHTKQDIDVYTRSRIEPEISGRYTEEGTADFDSLVDAIVEKAHGSFVWVRRVVDELIDGFVNGDTMEESKALLKTIPSELSALYARAISRIGQAPGGGTAASAARREGIRLEAHIMFQISACSIEPFGLEEFLNIVARTAEAYGLVRSRMHGLTSGQMRRRLNARSAGLLETTSFEGDNLGVVQFIHQSVKDYLASEPITHLTASRFDEMRRWSGTGMILEYLICQRTIPYRHLILLVFPEPRSLAGSGGIKFLTNKGKIAVYMQKIEMLEGIRIDNHPIRPPTFSRVPTRYGILHDLSKPYAKLIELDVSLIVLKRSIESQIVLYPSISLPEGSTDMLKEGRYDAFMEQMWAKLLHELFQPMPTVSNPDLDEPEERGYTCLRVLESLKVCLSNETLDKLNEAFDAFIPTCYVLGRDRLIEEWKKFRTWHNSRANAAFGEPGSSLLLEDDCRPIKT